MSKLDEMTADKNANPATQGANSAGAQIGQGAGTITQGHQAGGTSQSPASVSQSPSSAERPQANAGVAQQPATRETAPAPKPAGPKTLLVLDTTAVDGPRVHSQVVNDSVKNFSFESGKGLEMHYAIAVKFLKHESFKCVDENNNIVEWRRAPKQPDELGAGEQIKLSDKETIARVDELSKGSLLQRALEMPGGEKFTTDTPRSLMIDFIITTTTARRKAKEARPEMGKDEFVPEAELDDEDAA